MIFPARHHLYEWGGLTALLLLSLLFWGNFQEAWVRHHKSGDARVYMQMAQQHLDGKPFTQRIPFVYRQFTPWLAANIAIVLPPPSGF